MFNLTHIEFIKRFLEVALISIEFIEVLESQFEFNNFSKNILLFHIPHSFCKDLKTFISNLIFLNNIFDSVTPFNQVSHGDGIVFLL